MAEITSVRKIDINKQTITIEFTYIAEYNRDKKYFTNLDFDTAEGETDDAIDYLNDNLEKYLDHDYLDLTKAAMCFFEQAPNLDNIKFIDKYGYFKFDRIELEIAKW